MKTYNRLYEKICSFENLYRAARQAQKGKRFQENVARFNVNLEHELFDLQHELVNRIYQPGQYRTFEIFEPKKRTISAAPYRDRVVHHALCNIIAPLFEKTFIFDSYANRIGKGTHQAIQRYQAFCRKKAFALKCDIKKYFPAIDLEILKAEIRRTIACSETLWLIELIINSSNEQEPTHSYFPGDDLFTPYERRIGLPIGNLTSQFFANVYLNRFDHFVKERLHCKYYIRYVDDFVILDNEKKKLWEIKHEIERYLEQLRLRLHKNKCQIRKTSQGITFLGFRVFPTHRLLKRDNIIHATRRIRRLQESYAAGEISLDEIKCSIYAWLGHAGFGDTYQISRKILHNIRFEKRCRLEATSCARRLVEQ